MTFLQARDLATMLYNRGWHIASLDATPNGYQVCAIYKKNGHVMPLTRAPDIQYVVEIEKRGPAVQYENQKSDQ